VSETSPKVPVSLDTVIAVPPVGDGYGAVDGAVEGSAMTAEMIRVRGWSSRAAWNQGLQRRCRVPQGGRAGRRRCRSRVADSYDVGHKEEKALKDDCPVAIVLRQQSIRCFSGGIQDDRVRLGEYEGLSVFLLF
jgi:hypothetical protein